MYFFFHFFSSHFSKAVTKYQKKRKKKKLNLRAEEKTCNNNKGAERRTGEVRGKSPLQIEAVTAARLATSRDVFNAD